MKSILTLVISIFAITSFSGPHFGRVRYLHDAVRGALIDLSERISPDRGGVIIMNRGTTGRYRKSHLNLPGELHQVGSLLLYRAGKDTGIRSVADDTIRFTDCFTLGELSAAIKKVNGIRDDRIKEGEVLLIPNPLPALIPDYTAGRTRTISPVRGLYLTGSSAGGGSFPRLVAKMKEHGINAVVFDVKDITGIVNYRSGVAAVNRLDTHEKRSIHNIGKMIRLLKTGGIHVIARIAVFQDHLLARKAPALAIRSRKNGGVWNAGNKEIWLDPTSRQVQDYTLDLTRELLDLGVDEIQYDYIRFPTTGRLSDAAYSYDFGKMSNQQVITSFLKRAHAMIKAKNALLSIDIFGVVAWGKECDIEKTGQDIRMLARHCDIISPMLYPSHFNDDFDGFPNPGDQPYHFIYEGCRKVIGLSGGTVAVRPWLQAFRWRVSSYNPEYIRKQMKASDDSGAKGYLFWNASNDYRNVWRALVPESIIQQ